MYPIGELPKPIGKQKFPPMNSGTGFGLKFGKSAGDPLSERAR
ncbi:hypothetical protein FHT91_004522 [Rhizobium sp. BK347]|nr:hypothetical protein [Rhizobium sp. BK252]MBB3404465.1 hypothetical protein [Rhizobium sp. BK289]MBB3416851.1 hypothetical protein [Rhizobium sp. BK284]MBB3484728.1 hypothetical protein [Rhizobium sp. BK347]